MIKVNKNNFNKKDLENAIEMFQILEFDIEDSYGGVNLPEPSVINLRKCIENNTLSFKPESMVKYFLSSPIYNLVCDMYYKYPKLFSGEQIKSNTVFLLDSYDFPKYVKFI